MQSHALKDLSFGGKKVVLAESKSQPSHLAMTYKQYKRHIEGSMNVNQNIQSASNLS